MSLSTEFVADPVEFMETHIMLVSYMTAFDVNTVDNVGLVPMSIVNSDYEGYTRKNQKMLICHLIDGRKQEEHFPAFWCPYDNDRYRWTTISRHGDYVFTATMDGCSFGIGNITKQGTVTVGHANSGKEDRKKMAKEQKSMLTVGLGKNVKILRPRDYRKRGTFRRRMWDVSSTTIGLRDGNTWKFYAQRYMKEQNGLRVTFLGLKIFYG